MPVISRIGRRHWKVRLLVLSIYALLMAGGVTMVYPFLLMIAGSTKSDLDKSDSSLIPPYLRSDEALYRKHIEAQFNESVQTMLNVYYSDAPTFARLEKPVSVNVRLAGAWEEFIRKADLPIYCYTIGYVQAPMSRGVLPHALRAFKQELQARFDGDIGRMNTALQTEFVSWNAFFVGAESYHIRRERQGTGPFDIAFRTFKAGRPIEERHYFTIEGFHKNNYLKKHYSRDIKAYNEAQGTHYGSWSEVRLDPRLPQGEGRTEKERKDWESFVRTIAGLYWIRADAAAAPFYRRFLEAKYQKIEALNRNYGSSYGSFEKVPLVDEPPDDGLRLSDWDSFLQGWKDPDTGRTHSLPAAMIRIHGVESLFRQWLQSRHGSLENANAALGTTFKDWSDIMPPQQEFHYLAFQKTTGRLRWEFSRRNFTSVFDYVVLHGRAIRNTAIYCVLAILAALIVNPVAAYALSRQKLPSERKILLYLMLTMAFPPMVTQIPAFLMLREFGMLNTFWALILPGLANGFWIFLLKGFFDSLPRELYESAALDGAGELRIFWQITMSLSKPVLSLIGLSAFTAAYSNFMMALLICQDEKMWTLMPWLYQLQLRSGQGVIFASLIIAAIPTFLVFTFCQKIIMHGIVVPSEK